MFDGIVGWLKENFWILLLLFCLVVLITLYFIIGNFLYGDSFWEAKNMTDVRSFVYGFYSCSS